MRHLFFALRLCLALSVALVSVHTAAGRAAAMGAVELELCTGAEVVTISLDASGTPVKRHHACPDCVLSGLATLVAAGLPQPPAQGMRRLERPAQADLLRAGLPPCPMARGPPGPAAA
ncbi:MAG: hypothetical protein IPL38_11865 [Rhodobacter sp.]|jgi:hypothetical protein|nr:hypothetical protein [Rhodobacter sp.]MBK8440138.1 hypothetical protein [Rhodobacter sp.]